MQFCRLAIGLVAASSLLGATACNDSKLVSAPTPAPTPGAVTDTFTTTQSGGQSDILFVINNTDASMNYKAEMLANSATGFINYLVQQQVDFHIGVTSMDMETPFTTNATTIGSMGGLNGPANLKYIESSTPNLLASFQANLVVGSNGDSEELGIDAALAAVTSPMSTGLNAGFLRPAAKLFIVWMSDEEDNATTPGCANSFSSSCFAATYTPSDYVTAFANAKGGAADMVILSAITGPQTTSPVSNQAGCLGGSGSSSNPDSEGGDAEYEYAALISLSNGLFESICSASATVAPSYTTFLDNLGFQVGAPQSVYILTKVPTNPSTIIVKVNGAVVPAADWTYNATANTVTFATADVPASGATVSITYDVAP